MQTIMFANLCCCFSASPKWVNNQRRFQKNGKLSQERFDKLDKIGFQWSLRTSWNDRYTDLVTFWETNGHCLVSRSNESHDQQLARWVATQRANMKKGNLSPERIELLENIEFDFGN